MKSHYLFTGIMALTTLVVVSCSAPRMAQQNTNDDVYNSVAQAKEYSRQVPVRQQAPVTESEEYQTEDDYGTSDPFYDMDYSSRINRFSYPNPGWRSYYDPYFDGGWYGNYGMSLGLGLGFGYNPFYGSLWNSPYSRWGNYYSPFWGYNNYYGGGFYGGGYYGGGFYGGGYYGGGFYTGRTTPVDYKARPRRGGSVYTGSRGTEGLLPRTSRGQGNVVSGRPSRGMNNGSGTVNSGTARPSRTGSTNPNTQAPRPTRTESRPTRTESRPTRESYTPPPSYTPSRGSEGRSSGGGSYGGGGSSRPSRGGR